MKNKGELKNKGECCGLFFLNGIRNIHVTWFFLSFCMVKMEKSIIVTQNTISLNYKRPLNVKKIIINKIYYK